MTETGKRPRPLRALAIAAAALCCLLLANSPLLAQAKGGSKAAGAQGASGAAPAAPAASGAAMKIAVLDMTTAIDSTAEGKALQAKFKSEFEATSAKLNEKGQALEKRANDFNAKQAGMEESEKQRTGQALQKDITAYEAELKKYSDDFKAKVQKAMNPILERAEKAITDMAKANGYLAVVENGTQNAVLYADPGASVVDITAELTKALDSKKK